MADTTLASGTFFDASEVTVIGPRTWLLMSEPNIKNAANENMNGSARVTLFPAEMFASIVVPEDLAFHHEDDVLGDVGGEVADALQVARG